MYRRRKIHVRKDGVVPPLRQLKLQPEEMVRWAFELRYLYTTARIREMIGGRTGIQLGSYSSYTEFCKWYLHELELRRTEEVEADFERFCVQRNPEASAGAVREATEALALTRAIRQGKMEMALE